jgi:hypothetical protein
VTSTRDSEAVLVGGPADVFLEEVDEVRGGIILFLEFRNGHAVLRVRTHPSHLRVHSADILERTERIKHERQREREANIVSLTELSGTNVGICCDAARRLHGISAHITYTSIHTERQTERTRTRAVGRGLCMPMTPITSETCCAMSVGRLYGFEALIKSFLLCTHYRQPSLQDKNRHRRTR